MIRIAQFTARLDYLVARQRTDEANNEFDRIAGKVLGITFDDLFQADADRIGSTVMTLDEALSVCRRHGYELIVAGTAPVSFWHRFAILIVAGAEKIVPLDQRIRAERRLAIEADHFLRSIAGSNPGK